MRTARYMVMALAACLPGGAAHAGVFTDDLSKCLVTKLTPADQTTFMAWMLSAFSVSGVVKELNILTDAQHAKYNDAASRLFERMVIVDCRSQVIQAIKYEGPSAIRGAFEVFGRAAAIGLASNPDVGKQMAALERPELLQKFADLGKEAGVAPASTAPATGK